MRLFGIKSINIQFKNLIKLMTTLSTNNPTVTNPLISNLGTNPGVGATVIQNSTLPRVSEYSVNPIGSRPGSLYPTSSYAQAPITTATSNLPPYVITGSQVSRVGVPISSIRQQPIKVYTATGAPLPPVSTVYRPPVQSVFIRPATSIYPTNPGISTITSHPSIKTIHQKKYIEGGTVYQTVNGSLDQERQQRKKLYESSGYVAKKKTSPCLWGCLGLLLLAALLTGLFFLIRAINAGAGTPEASKSTDINFKNNATANTTTNGTVVTPTSPSGPAVIDVETNPTPTPVNNTSVQSVSVAPIVVYPNTTGNIYTVPPTYVTPTTDETDYAHPENTTTVTPTTTATTPSLSSSVSPQLYYSDPNIPIIDQFLRQQDAYKLGPNPTLTNLKVQNENGQTVYYLTQSTSTGKNYQYGVTMVNRQPSVQTVNVSQSPTVTAASHKLQSAKLNHKRVQGSGQNLRTLHK